MKCKTLLIVLALSSAFPLLSGFPVFAQSMAAESPMTDYTAAAVVQVLLVALLVVALIGGGLLVLNLSMMTKRSKDWVGHRDPSDIGILKHEAWEEIPYDENVLPAAAEEDADEDKNNKDKKKPPQAA